MGAIADAIAEYAQPLLDQTDGSLEQMNNAFSLAQLCWNLAVVPDEQRDEAVAKMQATLKMDGDQFDAFRRSVIEPMIRRHQDMFPRLHQRGSKDPSMVAPLSGVEPTVPARAEKYPGTGRNAPCPCNSGRKYKRCCGR